MNSEIIIIFVENTTAMLAKIVYILGIVIAIWCVLDIFKNSKLGIIGKVLVSLLVLALSWIGFVVYYFMLRGKI